MSRFNQITLTGSPRQRGRQHGSSLAAQIRLNLKFYQSIFGLPDSRLLDLGEEYYNIISEYNADFAQEILGIAEGASLDPRWIAALNARTEILSLTTGQAPAECTTLFSGPTALLGQNWDWSRTLEGLAVVMRIEFDDNFVIYTLTEPGILGKIGLNSVGLGVCLNILSIEQPVSGLPIHIVLRSLLESRSLAAAKHSITAVGHGKASSVLVADSTGAHFNVEFAGPDTIVLADTGQIPLHTNHYLHRSINKPENPDFASSYAREKMARQQLGAQSALDKSSLIAILSDRTNPEYPILRDYRADLKYQQLGTVCTIIMDLATREMHVRKGPHPASNFVSYYAK